MELNINNVPPASLHFNKNIYQCSHLYIFVLIIIQRRCIYKYKNYKLKPRSYCIECFILSGISLFTFEQNAET